MCSVPEIVNNSIQQADICVGLQHGDEGKGKVSYNLSKKNNIDLVITGIPHFKQFTGEQSDIPLEILKDVASENGTYYFDLYQDLRNNYENKELSNLYSKGDPTHFNKSGNKIWGDLFFEYLPFSIFLIACCIL